MPFYVFNTSTPYLQVRFALSIRRTTYLCESSDVIGRELRNHKLKHICMYEVQHPALYKYFKRTAVNECLESCSQMIS